MDSFLFHNVTSEKANASSTRYHRLRKMSDLFRFFEICVALLLLSWFSTKLPVTLKFFSDHFRQFSVILFSPRFVFLVGNAIILTLFAKSGQFSSPNTTSTNDLYEEYMKNSQNREKINTTSDIPPPVPEKDIVEKEAVSTATEPPEIIVCEDKQMVHEKPELKKVDITSGNKKYQRSQSENVKREKAVKKEFRRSKTDKSVEDEMSNEEFQRKIEEFIAKQVKFLREESMAIVPNNNNY